MPCHAFAPLVLATLLNSDGLITTVFEVTRLRVFGTSNFVLGLNPTRVSSSLLTNRNDLRLAEFKRIERNVRRLAILVNRPTAQFAVYI